MATNGYTGSMSVIEAVDEVQIARTTARGAYGQVASDCGFTGRGERCGLFVTYVLPLNAAVMEQRRR